MDRSYEIQPRPDGTWKLTLFEDNEEVGGGVGEQEDYEYLLDQAEEFCR